MSIDKKVEEFRKEWDKGFRDYNYPQHKVDMKLWFKQALQDTRNEALEECIKQVRCRCESHESHEEDATCKRRTEEIREELNKLKQ